jgi:hypothetical protein
VFYITHYPTILSYQRSCLHATVLHSSLKSKFGMNFLLFPLYVKCIFHLTLLELMTLIMFGEKMKLQNSSLCSSLQCAVTSLCDQLPSSAICSQSPACPIQKGNNNNKKQKKNPFIDYNTQYFRPGARLALKLA